MRHEHDWITSVEALKEELFVSRDIATVFPSGRPPAMRPAR
jgi:hypothetical protein